MSKKPSDALWRAAQRASQQPFFLASVFRAYQLAHRADDSALVDLLGCTADDLARLALCRRPQDGPGFAADVDHLAARFRLNGERLASLIREIDALDALRAHLAADKRAPGMLRAARDRDEPEPSGKEDCGD